jgi:dihydroorotase
MGFERLELFPTTDCHVHLRDGDLMKTVMSSLRAGGTDTAYVMVGYIFFLEL